MLKAFASTASVRMLGIALSFIQSIVLARIFGADVFGVFSFAVAIISFADIIMTLGLDQLLMRELAQKGDELALRSQVYRTLRRLIVVLVFPSVSLVTLVGVLVFGVLEPSNPYRVPVFVVLITFIFLVGRKFSEAIALGLKLQLRSIIGSKILFPASMILGALIVPLLGLARSETTISGLYVIALFFSAVVAIWLVRHSHVLRRQYAASSDAVRTRDVLVPSLNLAFVLSANIIMNNMDTVLIAFLADPESAGLARVAQRLAEAAVIFEMVIMLHFKPLIAESYAQGDTRKLRSYLRVIALTLGGVGTVVFVTFFVFASPLALIFGGDFRSADVIIRAYAFGAYAMTLAGPGMHLLTLTSKEAVASRIMWGALVVNLLLDFALIPYFGGLGAGIATSISQVILAIGLLCACRRHLGLDASIFSYTFPKLWRRKGK